MQELWDLSGRTVLLIILSSALFGATAAYALALYGRFSRVVAIIVGIVFSFPGVAVLGIVALARRSGERSARIGAVQPAAVAPVADGGPGYLGFDDWTATATASPAASQTTDSWGFDSYDAVETVAVPAPARAPRRSIGDRVSAAWVRTTSGRVTALSGGAAVLLVVVSIFVGWLSINAAVIPRFWFYPFGTGLDIALLVTAIVAGSIVAGLTTRPFLSLAVLLAWVADTWLVLSLLLISSRYTVAGFLEEIGALTLSVGDVLQSIGLDTTAGVVDLPPGVDLSSLGVAGRTIDMSSMELGAVIPDVTIDIGPGVYLVIAFALLANVAAFSVLRAADRARSATVTQGGAR